MAVVSMDPRSNRYHRIELSEWEAKFLETNKAHLWELAVAAECLGASRLRLASLMLIAEVAEKEDAWTLSYIFGVFNESLSQPRHHQVSTCLLSSAHDTGRFRTKRRSKSNCVAESRTSYCWTCFGSCRTRK